jgi:hypothetical protein
MVKEQNQSSNGKELEQTCSIGLSKLSVIQEEGSSNNDDDDDDELLKTPTGQEHKIPQPLKCPGAPPRVKTFKEIPFNPVSVRYKILKFEFE